MFKRLLLLASIAFQTSAALAQGGTITFPTATLSGTYQGAPTGGAYPTYLLYPFVFTTKAKMTRFANTTDPSKSAELASIERWAKANVGNYTQQATAYAGSDLTQYQNQFSTFPTGGAATWAARFALYAYLHALNPAYGDDTSAASARTAANTILVNWATNGFKINGVEIVNANVFTQTLYTNATPPVAYQATYPEFAVGEQIGRGMVDYVAAAELMADTTTSSPGSTGLTPANVATINAFGGRMLQVLEQGANYHYSQAFALGYGDGHVYDNQASMAFQALLAVARFVNNADLIHSMAGDAAHPVMLWSFAQQVEGNVYGTNDVLRYCYDVNPSVTPQANGLRYTATTSLGEIADRYRDAVTGTPPNTTQVDPLGYPLGSLASLLQTARMLGDAGYNAAGYTGSLGQSLLSPLNYYSFYFVNWMNWTDTVIPVGSNSYPDYAAYDDVNISVTTGATVAASDGLLDSYLIGQNLYPAQPDIANVLHRAESLASANGTVAFTNWDEIANVEAWQQ